MDELTKHKSVLCEPRRSDQLDELLKNFYETIEETADNTVGREVTGALFMAVCRGKVSEGLDFADKNARIVITVSLMENFVSEYCNIDVSYTQHSVVCGQLGRFECNQGVVVKFFRCRCYIYLKMNNFF